MAWQSDGDNVSFSGPLADLMSIIMTAFDQDCVDSGGRPTAGEYVTAAAVVLREVMLENFEHDPEAEEFVQRISEALQEDEDGTVQIATFALLDDIAEHIDAPALEHWMGSASVRAAILELASAAFA